MSHPPRLGWVNCELLVVMVKSQSIGVLEKVKKKGQKKRKKEREGGRKIDEERKEIKGKREGAMQLAGNSGNNCKRVDILQERK